MISHRAVGVCSKHPQNTINTQHITLRFSLQQQRYRYTNVQERGSQRSTVFENSTTIEPLHLLFFSSFFVFFFFFVILVGRHLDLRARVVFFFFLLRLFLFFLFFFGTCAGWKTRGWLSRPRDPGTLNERTSGRLAARMLEE